MIHPIPCHSVLSSSLDHPNYGRGRSKVDAHPLALGSNLGFAVVHRAPQIAGIVGMARCAEATLVGLCRSAILEAVGAVDLTGCW